MAPSWPRSSDVKEPSEVTNARHTTPSIAILGAGAGGLAIGHALKRQGIETFTIYERLDGVGGVWRQNTYPGAACDVKSHFYSFSWEMNPSWSAAYAPQREILEYFEHIADKYDLRAHIRLNTTIDELRWHENGKMWTIHTGAGEIFEAQIVVSALGTFSEPQSPDLAGLDDFAGTSFHSARWDHGHDLRGENVAVIGTGPSAIQLVPQIAPLTKHVYVFQRQPGWLVPKAGSSYTKRQKWIFRHVPLVARAHRLKIWKQIEWGAPIRPEGSTFRERTDIARRFIERSVDDLELRSQLLPSYPLGCKRLLPTNDWLPTLQRPDVTLVTTPIARVDQNAIVTGDGAEYEADCIIFASGFKAAKYLSSVRITGRKGQLLDDEWADGVRAHLGMTVHGFPNFFMLYGPNTNGTTSVLHVIEAQTRYFMKILKFMLRRSYAVVEVNRPALDRYNDRLQRALVGTVWLGGCKSYFLDEHGKVRTQYPYRFHRYWLMTWRLKSRHYAWERGEEPASPSPWSWRTAARTSEPA